VATTNVTTLTPPAAAAADAVVAVPEAAVTLLTGTMLRAAASVPQVVLHSPSGAAARCAVDEESTGRPVQAD
jgi:hypothetical protein